MKKVTTRCEHRAEGTARADRLIAALYEDLKQAASHTLRHERRDWMLQTTELLHETYVRMVDQRNVRDMDELAFRAAVANTMRRVLVDTARAQRALKRGGAWGRLSLDDINPSDDGSNTDLLALDEALIELGRSSPRKQRIVELRFFGGLTVEQVSTLLRVPRRSVERDWTFARAWLRDRLFTD